MIYWDPDPRAFTIPFLQIPVLWYGFFFAAGFFLAVPLFTWSLRKGLTSNFTEKALTKLVDKLILYVLIGTILGARVGHFLFYESPSLYLKDPMQFFYLRQGGLASHGAVVGICLSLWFFQKQICRKGVLSLSYLRLLDLLTLPTALVGGMIRLGNFVNQEILGKITSLPWGVIFGNPIDQSVPVPRHPVQLYEAFFYFLLALILARFVQTSFWEEVEGKRVGFFLIFVFVFRFFIEFIKEEQSRLMEMGFLNMGQLLSIPVIILGLFLFFRSKKVA